MRRGICPRVSGGKKFSPLSFIGSCNMEAKRTLSVFVDESGRFQHPDEGSRFYILGMLFHDQSYDIASLVEDLELAEAELGLENHCFHAGPLIRKEKGYGILSRSFRGRILSRMMAFASRVNFKYRCLSVDKKFIDSPAQILERLKSGLADFIAEHRDFIASLGRVKIYYDCGQSPVTRMLPEVFETGIGRNVEFANAVRPSRTTERRFGRIRKRGSPVGLPRFMTARKSPCACAQGLFVCVY